MSQTSQFSGVIGWIDRQLPVFSYFDKEYVRFPTPRNLNYFWSFGGIAMIMLAIMIITGILLAMQYTPHTDHAFDSVERIMRDVNYGWLLRYMHMNGASLFFVAVYIHIWRGMYYGSYKKPRELLWILGVVILMLMMATAFMGYVLPWGQMSFWGATVITNLFSAIPWGIGDAIVALLWGGFSVDNPTLNRFFALHYVLPFVILAVVGLHVIALHVARPNNPEGIEVRENYDTLPFHPFFTVKDFAGISLFLLIYLAFVFYAPDFLGHPVNYIPANPLSTPEHIVPEWYFLPFYAILRAIPDKLLGVIAMFGSIFILFALPWLDRSKVRSCRYRPVYKWMLIALGADIVFLGYLGSQPAEGVYVTLARLGAFWYFLHFLVLTPLTGWLETPRELPASIREPVLKTLS